MMDSVKKNRALVSIIIFLLITNLAMLIAFLMWNNDSASKTQHAHDGMTGMLQKEVGFSKQQLDSYQSLRKQQIDSIHTMFDELKNAKLDFYNMLYMPGVSDSALEAAAENVAEKQKALEIKMFYHFKNVRAICTPDQLPKFDTAIKKVVVRMISRNNKPQHSNN